MFACAGVTGHCFKKKEKKRRLSRRNTGLGAVSSEKKGRRKKAETTLEGPRGLCFILFFQFFARSEQETPVLRRRGQRCRVKNKKTLSSGRSFVERGEEEEERRKPFRAREASRFIFFVFRNEGEEKKINVLH